MTDKPAPEPAKREVKVTATFEGPIPPPAILGAYETLQKGLASRIVAMAEKQSEHRQHIEKVVVTAKSRDSGRGQWFAFVLAALSITFGFILIWSGKSTEGLVAIIAPITALASVFVYGRHKERVERREKERLVREG